MCYGTVEQVRVQCSPYVVFFWLHSDCHVLNITAAAGSAQRLGLLNLDNCECWRCHLWLLSFCATSDSPFFVLPEVRSAVLTVGSELHPLCPDNLRHRWHACGRQEVLEPEGKPTKSHQVLVHEPKALHVVVWIRCDLLFFEQEPHGLWYLPAVLSGRCLLGDLAAKNNTFGFTERSGKY